MGRFWNGIEKMRFLDAFIFKGLSALTIAVPRDTELVSFLDGNRLATLERKAAHTEISVVEAVVQSSARSVRSPGGPRRL